MGCGGDGGVARLQWWVVLLQWLDNDGWLISFVRFRGRGRERSQMEKE